MMCCQEGIFAQGQGWYRGVAEPFLGHAAKPLLPTRCCALSTHGVATQRKRLCLRQPTLPGECLKQFILTISRHTSDADDLPGTHLQVQILQGDVMVVDRGQ